MNIQNLRKDQSVILVHNYLSLQVNRTDTVTMYLTMLRRVYDKAKKLNHTKTE